MFKEGHIHFQPKVNLSENFEYFPMRQKSENK